MTIGCCGMISVCSVVCPSPKLPLKVTRGRNQKPRRNQNDLNLQDSWQPLVCISPGWRLSAMGSLLQGGISNSKAAGVPLVLRAELLLGNVVQTVKIED